MRHQLPLASALIPCLMLAQSVSKPESRERAPTPLQKKEQSLTPEQKFAHEMLDRAMAQARALPPEPRALLLHSVALGYSKYDKKKEREALQRAFTAALEAEKQGARPIGPESLALSRLLDDFGPDAITELLPQANEIVRAGLKSALTEYYLGHQQLDRAIALVESADPDAHYPYSAATDVMLRLPPERNADLLAIFAHALTAYKDGGGLWSTPSLEDDIGAMVVRFEHRLPPKIILQAVDEVLERDKTNLDEGNSDAMMAAYTSGTVAFKNIYDFRLFQLLPVLRDLDPSRAESLLKENTGLSNQLQQFPDATRSLAPELSDKQDEHGASSMIGVTYGSASPQQAAEFDVDRKMETIINSASKDPDSAILNAQRLPLPQASRTLASIAEENWKANNSAARTALDKAIALAADLEPEETASLASRAAYLYEESGEQENAQKMIELGLKQADELYNEDYNPDDPNLELKPRWPSANAYRYFVLRAAKISLPYALKTMKEIPDDEIQLDARITLANALLGAPSLHSVVRRKTKRHMSVGMQNFGPMR